MNEFPPEKATAPEQTDRAEADRLRSNLTHKTALVERFNYTYSDAQAGLISYSGNFALEDILRDELGLDEFHRPIGDGEAIRHQLIEALPSSLDSLGLELSTPTDLGRDMAGKHRKLTGTKVLPLALTIADGEKYNATLCAIYGTHPEDPPKGLYDTVYAICADTARVIRGGYTSTDELVVADAERILSNAAVVIPTLDELGATEERSGVKNSAGTLKRYVAHYQAGTLEDYLGAERVDLVVEEREALPPRAWGTEPTGYIPLTPTGFEAKWRTALDYLAALKEKDSPLFEELFSELRETFEAKLTWFNGAAQMRDAEAPTKAAILQKLEEIWTDKFMAESAIYQIENQHEAAEVARFAMAFGLKPNEIPPLPTEVDAIAIELARGILGQKAQQIEAYASLLPSIGPSGGGFDRYKVRNTTDDSHRRTIYNIGHRDGAHSTTYQESRGHVGGGMYVQLDVNLTIYSDGTMIMTKEIPHIAEGNEGQTARLKVVVGKDAIRANLRGGILAGETHYDYNLPPAESIQAAAAILKIFQKEIATRR